MNGLTINTPVTELRALYLRVMDVLGGNFQATPRTLRMEQAVTARTQYKFNFYENAAQDSSTEIKLSRTDAFFISHLGLNLRKGGGTTEHESVLQTWPNPEIFTTAGAAAELEQFYNSKITFSTSPVNRLTDLHTSFFRYNPGRINDTNAALGNSMYGPSMEQKGYFAIQPGIILDGYQDNELILDTGDSVFSNAVGQNNYVVALAFGFVVANGARKFQDQYYWG